jgi:hypothetical protein
MIKDMAARKGAVNHETARIMVNAIRRDIVNQP